MNPEVKPSWQLMNVSEAHLEDFLALLKGGVYGEIEAYGILQRSLDDVLRNSLRVAALSKSELPLHPEWPRKEVAEKFLENL